MKKYIYFTIIVFINLILVLHFENYMIDNEFIFLFLIFLLSKLIFFLNENNRKNLYGVLIFLILTIYDNRGIYFIPSFLFGIEIIYEKYLFFIAFAGVFSLYDIRFFPIYVISYTLYYLLMEYEKMSRKYISIRDFYEEKNQTLEKNRLKILTTKELENHNSVMMERERIARKLHESVGHTISASILQLEALKVISDKNIKSGIDNIQNNLKNGMFEIRETLHNLKKSSFDLELKVKEILDNLDGVEYFVKIVGLEDINLNFKFDILSIIKECITNTIKHSDATKITINIFKNKKYIILNFSDNGSKFVKADNIKYGIGIISIIEITEKYFGNINFNYDNGFNVHLILEYKNE